MSEPSEVFSKGERLLEKLDTLLSKIENKFPDIPEKDSALEGNARIFSWVRRGQQCFLKPIDFQARVHLNDLMGIDRQKRTLVRNTRQFLNGCEANNVLLWGARGTGKSSLIRALVSTFVDEGLHLIELGKDNLRDLPDIVEMITAVPSRFILFCDDLSFEADEPGFGDLKALLDGSLSTASDRFLIYATSNRRHLIPENLETTSTVSTGQEIHPEEAVDTHISLSERFGLWLPFYPFSQEMYLKTVLHWLKTFNIDLLNQETIKEKALQWAMTRGSRSGRTAWQFAGDYAGRVKMALKEKGQ